MGGKPRSFRAVPQQKTEGQSIDRILRAMAFPVSAPKGSTIAAGQTKFEFYSNNIFAQILAKQMTDVNDQDLMVLARKAVRAAQALMAAQAELIEQIRMKEEEAKAQAKA